MIEQADIDLQQISETVDGGLHWSQPKEQRYEPASKGQSTSYNEDRAVYLAKSDGSTRLGVMCSRTHLLDQIDKLDIAQYVITRFLQLEHGLWWANQAEMKEALVPISKRTTQSLVRNISHNSAESTGAQTNPFLER